MALVLVLVLIGVIGVLVLNTRIAENAFRLDDAADQAEHRSTGTRQRLRSDLAEQESPGDARAAAAKQLGLVPPRTPAFLRAADGTKLEMPASEQVTARQPTTGSRRTWLATHLTARQHRAAGTPAEAASAQ